MYTSGKYEIDIYQDRTYKKGCADNTYVYDFEYFEENENYFATILGIRVFEEEELLNSAIIAGSEGATGIYEDSVIFEEDRCLICCSDTIFCLSIPYLKLLWKTKADMITCFKIFNHQDKYIIHGELSITCLDKNGNIVWQQSGRDIFVVMDDEPNFSLEKDYIMASDFNNETYKFGYDGNIIEDK